MYGEGYEFAGHSLWPKHVDVEDSRVLIGGPDCTQPYSASLLNISAMSYGALSDNAVLALSTAAQNGRFYHNTGEGGMSRFHLAGGADLVWNVGTGYFGCGSGAETRMFDPVQVGALIPYSSHPTRSRNSRTRPAAVQVGRRPNPNPNPVQLAENATRDNCKMVEIKLRCARSRGNPTPTPH